MLGLTRAPEIRRDGLAWFNVDHPLSLGALKGRLTVLDFWTFCCINCAHVQPALRRLENAFPDEVAVIGVHSPKFPAERDPALLAHAIARYGIRHPVIHDPGLTLWQEYCVRAWPTLVLIAPDGYVVGALAGEPDAERLIEGVGEMLRSYRANGLLAPSPLRPAPLAQHDGCLAYPGSIKPLRGSDGAPMWAVASTGQHQIVVFDDRGIERKRFGRGKAGLADCGAESSAFHSPQGLICGAGRIFVADTGNHAIRRIDVDSGEVVTLAGTGERGTELDGGERKGSKTALASVWDLEARGDNLFFTNAGTHQIGALDLARQTVVRLAGTGNEDLCDGPASSARLAQPSGLALGASKDRLYFVDAESSAVRSLSLNGAPAVETLVGRGLFDFGDSDGSFAAARLQHPLGIAAFGDDLLVADSYNGILRVVGVRSHTVSRLGEADYEGNVGPPAGEPAGVAVAGADRILVADTNNHRILEVRPSQRRVRTWAG